ncbi:hypothetical protein ACSLOD_27915, partial [Escherichia coli]
MRISNIEWLKKRIGFIRKLGERHAWSFAIHNPKASIDGGEQPHAHIMMSQRVNDGIERTPEQ